MGCCQSVWDAYHVPGCLLTLLPLPPPKTFSQLRPRLTPLPSPPFPLQHADKSPICVVAASPEAGPDGQVVAGAVKPLLDLQALLVGVGV